MNLQIKIGQLLLMIIILFLNSDSKINIVTVSDEEINSNKLRDKLYPYEDYFIQKQPPNTPFNVDYYTSLLIDIERWSNQPYNRINGEWTVQGPGNLGARINTIAINPNNEDIMYAGFSGAGLFKTIDGGAEWVPIFDQNEFLAIGDIAIHPTNSDILFVGTGDPNISGYPSIGNGLFKSIDGGATWTYVGFREDRIVSQIRISETDPNIMYVSTMGLPFEKSNKKGLYKSINGGDDWEKILFVNDSTGVIDLALHPTNPEILYACTWNRIRNNKQSLVSGPDAHIYKTENGGQSWQKLLNGLPNEARSRIGIDIARSSPNILYATYVDTDLNIDSIYTTSDGGDTWKGVAPKVDSGLPEGIYSGFGWYFGKIRVNPTNPNDVFVLGVDLYRSLNGGGNWFSAAPPWFTYEVHADKHDLVFTDNNIYLATDGGMYSSDHSASIWNDIENIPATQFYRVGLNPHFVNNYYGGAQDNGTTGGSASNINEWERIYGGDGFQPLFDTDDPNIYYVMTQNGGINMTLDGGESYINATNGRNIQEPKNWDTPLFMSQNNTKKLYTGTDRLYRSVGDPIPFWQPISPDLTDKNSDFFVHNITTIAESPLDSNLLAVGTSDAQVWVSDDEGQNWINVSSGLPDRYVSHVSFSPDSPKSLYVSFTGYKDNDFTPYIYLTHDLGNSWTPINGNLPPIAINNFEVLPLTSDIIDNIYICTATDAGVFYTSDHGATWQKMGTNMPNVKVFDITYNNNELFPQLVAGTFGRGIMTFNLSDVGYYVSSNDMHINDHVQYLPFPNPTQDILYIQNAYDGQEFVLFDSNGCFINSVCYSNVGISLRSLSAGTYFIMPLIQNKTTKPRRIIKRN